MVLHYGKPSRLTGSFVREADANSNLKKPSKPSLATLGDDLCCEWYSSDMDDGSKSRRGRFGFSREEWLAAALQALESGGVDAVRVKRLAEAIGVNKSGFYYHFADRDGLMAAMLDYWAGLEQKPLEEFKGNPLDAPEDALRKMAEIVDRDDLARYDAAIRQWANEDEHVAQVYELKMHRRLEIVRSLFSALGFDGLSCEMRARTYVGFISTERELFRDQSASDRAELREARLQLLLSNN